jgi:dTDP-4-dehydrorhamnose reductase
MLKRVLVTGANGFIGKQLLNFFNDTEFEIYACSSKSYEDEKSKNIIWIKVNLLNDSESINVIEKIRPDILVHFAWITDHGKFWYSEENLNWVGSSLRLLKSFVEI